jgi:uncharacterized protein YqhQ
VVTTTSLPVITKIRAVTNGMIMGIAGCFVVIVGVVFGITKTFLAAPTRLVGTTETFMVITTISVGVTFFEKTPIKRGFWLKRS